MPILFKDNYTRVSASSTRRTVVQMKLSSAPSLASITTPIAPIYTAFRIESESESEIEIDQGISESYIG